MGQGGSPSSQLHEPNNVNRQPLLSTKTNTHILNGFNAGLRTTRFTNQKRKTLLLNNLRIRTLTHRTHHKRLRIMLNQTVQSIIFKLTMKNSPSIINRPSSSHLTRQITQQMQRITIQSQRNIPKINNIRTHTNSTTPHPRNLKTLMLKNLTRQLTMRTPKQLHIIAFHITISTNSSINANESSLRRQPPSLKYFQNTHP